MKRSLIAAAVVVATTAAQAENVTTLYGNDNSYWTVKHFERNDAGKSMCTMHTRFAPGGKGDATGWIYVKYKPNLFAIHIEKTNWNMRAGARIPLRITFDSDRRWNGYAVARRYTNAPKDAKNNMLEIIFDNGLMPQFLRDFRGSDRMVLSFDYGNERPWEANMIGSRDASQVFAACAAALDGKTQPGEAPDEDNTQPGEGPPRADKKGSRV